MKATGYSTWRGSWKQGDGTISTESDTLRSQPYTFASRFEGAKGASPEELLAAAHAGCFNQALANNFGMLQLEADSIDTVVVIEMGHDEKASPTLTKSVIVTKVRVPGASQEQFRHCAERARTHCSISKVLKCDIELDATMLP
jgi:osmotically inducible protein OsmC